MELNSGICGICDSENEIINPEDSGAFWDMICEIFEDELDNLLILKSQLKICSTCIFRARLIETKKDILKSEITDVDTKSRNKCRFCKDDICVLKVENSALFKITESCRTSRAKGSSIICASCYYVIKASFNLKTNLTLKLSEFLNSSSTLKDGVHSIKSEAGSSNDKTNSIKKTRKTLMDENNAFPKKTFSHSDILNNEIEKGDYVLISDDENISKKSRKNKNKKLEEPRVLEDMKQLSVNYDNVSHKISRKRKLSSSAEESTPKLKKSHDWQTHARNNLDMSRVLCLMPLSKTNFKVNEVVRQDGKFYNCIPYVKVSAIKKSEKKSSDIAEHISNKRPCSSPMGIIKRTPPIKIKLKKVPKVKKVIVEKKHNRKISMKGEVSSNSTKFDEFKKKEVIVKVERMKLPTHEEEIEPHSKKTESERSIVAYESVLKDTSLTEVTPKKKKRVHFNDTPTIIITGDDISDLDSSNEDEDIPKRKNSRNVKSLKYEEESLQEEHSIEIDSEESEDDQTITIDEEIEDVEKVKLMEKEKEEGESVEVMEIEVSDDESEQLATSNDQIKHGEECMDIDLDDVIEEKEEMEEYADKTIKNMTENQNSNHNSESEAKTHEKCDQADQLKEPPSEKKKSKNLEQQDAEEEEIHIVEEDCSIVEDSDDEANGSVEEKIASEERTEVENSDSQENKTMFDKDSDEEKMDDLQVVDECCDEILEENIMDRGEKKKDSEPEDTVEILKNGDTVEVEKKQEDELDADKIVVNDIVLSEATTASEDFGSLIDEVQKCLTSNKDLSSEDPVIEIHDAPTAEIDKVFEKDDPLSCLNDIDRGLDSPFTENLIDDDKTSNVETDTSSLNEGIKIISSVEDDTEKSNESTELSDSLK